jgi:hypothetical protein
MTGRITGLDHVQIPIPAGGEDRRDGGFTVR